MEDGDKEVVWTVVPELTAAKAARMMKTVIASVRDADSSDVASSAAGTATAAVAAANVEGATAEVSMPNIMPPHPTFLPTILPKSPPMSAMSHASKSVPMPTFLPHGGGSTPSASGGGGMRPRFPSLPLSWTRELDVEHSTHRYILYALIGGLVAGFLLRNVLDWFRADPLTKPNISHHKHDHHHYHHRVPDPVQAPAPIPAGRPSGEDTIPQKRSPPATAHRELGDAFLISPPPSNPKTFQNPFKRARTCKSVPPQDPWSTFTS